MEEIYLGLGSNRGASVELLEEATAALAQGLSDLRVSSIWKSEARYLIEQEPFYNLVIGAKTVLDPEALLAFCSSIEARFGRDRSREIPKGPRSLDIDLLLFGNRIYRSDDLILPHPGLLERKFVLLPLLELEARLVHPETGQSLLGVLSALPAQGIYLISRRSYDGLYI